MSEWIGRELEGYRIVEQLSSGQTSALVFKAVRLSDDSPVVIKLLSHDLQLVDPDARVRLEREREVLEKLKDCEFVVHSLGYHETADKRTVFLVTEFKPDGTLGQYLQHLKGKHTEPNIHEVLALFANIAEGVDYAHRRGIQHRDLKPANIVLHRLSDSDIRAYVADFGVAISEKNPRLTQSGTAPGSPLYRAPELWVKGAGKFLPKADIYSLGIMLYEALEGEPPPIDKDVVRPAKLELRTNRAVGDALLKAVRRDPEQRYLTATDFILKVNEAIERGERINIEDTRSQMGLRLSRLNLIVACLAIIAGAFFCLFSGLLTLISPPASSFLSTQVAQVLWPASSTMTISPTIPSARDTFARAPSPGATTSVSVTPGPSTTSNTQVPLRGTSPSINTLPPGPPLVSTASLTWTPSHTPSSVSATPSLSASATATPPTPTTTWTMVSPTFTSSPTPTPTRTATIATSTPTPSPSTTATATRAPSPTPTSTTGSTVATYNFDSGPVGWNTSEGGYKRAETSLSSERFYTGGQSLRVDTDLFAEDSDPIFHHTETTAYFSSFPPTGMAQPGPYNLFGLRVTCYVNLPTGLADNAYPPLVQVFIKDTSFRNMFSAPTGITTSNTDQWFPITMELSASEIQLRADAGFDATNANTLGVRVITSSGSTLRYSGPFFVDYCTIGPP